jgi:hypothetical protein
MIYDFMEIHEDLPNRTEEEEEEEVEITSVQPKGHDEMTLSTRNNHIGKSKQNLTRAKST